LRFIFRATLSSIDSSSEDEETFTLGVAVAVVASTAVVPGEVVAGLGWSDAVAVAVGL